MHYFLTFQTRRSGSGSLEFVQHSKQKDYDVQNLDIVLFIISALHLHLRTFRWWAYWEWAGRHPAKKNSPNIKFSVCLNSFVANDCLQAHHIGVSWLMVVFNTQVLSYSFFPPFCFAFKNSCMIFISTLNKITLVTTVLSAECVKVLMSGFLKWPMLFFYMLLILHVVSFYGGPTMICESLVSHFVTIYITGLFIYLPYITIFQMYSFYSTNTALNRKVLVVVKHCVFWVLLVR